MENSTVKLCECGCGNPAPIAKATAKRFGYIKGQPMRFIQNHKKCIDLTGQRFGRLVVLRLVAPKAKDRGAYFLCQCDCGVTKVIQGNSLKTGHTVSCGCFNNDNCGKLAQNYLATHKEYGTPIYRIWNTMIQRCRNEKSTSYEHYGGRGITVCERWHKFENFLADMGHRPTPKHSIDRINNDGNYEPGNCRWATQQEQHNNSRFNKFITYQGQTKTLAQWCAFLGLEYNIIQLRLSRHWTVERALTTPNMGIGYHPRLK